MTNRVLVTGGAGYIGSHICKALALAGYTPVTYDSLEIGNRSAVKWGPLVEGNILDKSLLSETIKMFRPIAVFHLASYSNMRESLSQKDLYYKNNLVGTASVLECLTSAPPRCFLFSSSASVYGAGSNSPLKENSPVVPGHPYGHTKLLSEYMIEGFCKQRGIHYGNLRYFNAAGADPDGEIGEAHDPETHLIPLLIQVLKNEKAEFSLLNRSHKTADGTAERDFIHVSDLAEGHILAFRFMESEKKNLTINLGSGKGHTILEIVKRLEELSGKKIRVVSGQPTDEPGSLIADITSGSSLIGWNPKHSTLDTILQTALHWHL